MGACQSCHDFQRTPDSHFEGLDFPHRELVIFVTHDFSEQREFSVEDNETISAFLSELQQESSPTGAADNFLRLHCGDMELQGPVTFADQGIEDGATLSTTLIESEPLEMLALVEPLTLGEASKNMGLLLPRLLQLRYLVEPGSDDEAEEVRRAAAGVMGLEHFLLVAVRGLFDGTVGPELKVVAAGVVCYLAQSDVWASRLGSTDWLEALEALLATPPRADQGCEQALRALARIARPSCNEAGMCCSTIPSPLVQVLSTGQPGAKDVACGLVNNLLAARRDKLIVMRSLFQSGLAAVISVILKDKQTKLM